MLARSILRRRATPLEPSPSALSPATSSALMDRKVTYASSATFSSSANPLSSSREQGCLSSFKIRMLGKPEAIMVRMRSSASVPNRFRCGLEARFELAQLNRLDETNAGMGSVYRSQHDSCRCSRTEPPHTSTTSNSGGVAGGAQTCGPILAPPRSAPTPAAAYGTIRPSSRP